jgi:hypothetical protein
MNNITDEFGASIHGIVKIIDYDTQEILVHKINAINFESTSYALALSLADRPNGSIMQMLFGNGASSVSANGVITYLPPNVAGLTATLYNQTFAQFVNDQSPLDTDTVDNFLAVNHTTNTTYSDVVVTCLLDYNEPSGQQAFDNATQANGLYIFDEIGLSTYNTSTATGMMLSHVIFHPVQKALDRRIQIIYTIRIVMA